MAEVLDGLFGQQANDLMSDLLSDFEENLDSLSALLGEPLETPLVMNAYQNDAVKNAPSSAVSFGVQRVKPTPLVMSGIPSSQSSPQLFTLSPQQLQVPVQQQQQFQVLHQRHLQQLQLQLAQMEQQRLVQPMPRKEMGLFDSNPQDAAWPLNELETIPMSTPATSNTALPVTQGPLPLPTLRTPQPLPPLPVSISPPLQRVPSTSPMPNAEKEKRRSSAMPPSNLSASAVRRMSLHASAVSPSATVPRPVAPTANATSTSTVSNRNTPSIPTAVPSANAPSFAVMDAERKNAHSVIERRYRNNINSRLTELKHLLPCFHHNRPDTALLAASTSPSHCACSASKANKALILHRAIERLRELEQAAYQQRQMQDRMKCLLREHIGAEEADRLLQLAMNTTELKSFPSSSSLQSQSSNSGSSASSPSTSDDFMMEEEPEDWGTLPAPSNKRHCADNDNLQDYGSNNSPTYSKSHYLLFAVTLGFWWQSLSQSISLSESTGNRFLSLSETYLPELQWIWMGAIALFCFIVAMFLKMNQRSSFIPKKSLNYFKGKESFSLDILMESIQSYFQSCSVQVLKDIFPILLRASHTRLGRVYCHWMKRNHGQGEERVKVALLMWKENPDWALSVLQEAENGAWLELDEATDFFKLGEWRSFILSSNSSSLLFLMGQSFRQSLLLGAMKESHAFQSLKLIRVVEQLSRDVDDAALKEVARVMECFYLWRLGEKFNGNLQDFSKPWQFLLLACQLAMQGKHSQSMVLVSSLQSKSNSCHDSLKRLYLSVEWLLWQHLFLMRIQDLSRDYASLVLEEWRQMNENCLYELMTLEYDQESLVEQYQLVWMKLEYWMGKSLLAKQGLYCKSKHARHVTYESRLAQYFHDKEFESGQLCLDSMRKLQSMHGEWRF